MKPNLQVAAGIVTCLLLLVSVRTGASLQSLYRNERATIGDREGLWTNGTVYYSFFGGISQRLEDLLQDAMTEWEMKTCLRFQQQVQEKDYVKFYSYPNEEYCTCDSVGRMGGEQEIQLGYSCQSKGELLHIIGHVVGFWHEQARPDRDSYVQILNENIDEGQEKHFEKRNTFTIDYQGIGYDYGSIMHLGAIAYSKNGYETTKTLQGDHDIGQREELSKDDIRKVSALYHCPVQRVEPGKLQVTIKNVTLYSLVNANPRIEVTAVDSNGDETTMHTAERKFGRDDAQTQETESIDFPVKEPRDWQFFRIRILGDAQLALSKTVHIIPGQYRQSKYCISEDCDEYLEYAYKYIEDGNECRHNPCNHGSCTDLFVGYMCNCPTSYYGDYCEHSRCEINPCQNGGTCELDSTNQLGYTCQCTNSYSGDQCQRNRCDPNPCQRGGTCQLAPSYSRGYTCQCTNSYDGDQCQRSRCDPNPCHSGGTCQLAPSYSRGYTCQCTNSYDGDQCQRNRCDPNPCQNGGTCALDSTNQLGYTCQCTNSYDGDQCQRNRCDPNPCQSGGTCQLAPSNSRGYTCSCSPYYSGDQCELYNHCYPNPCLNSGWCSNNPGSSQGFTCYCRYGYHGYQCQYTDSCAPSPCQNMGTCTRNQNSYSCSCEAGFTGINCEVRTGQLRVYVRSGHNLPDEDGWFAGRSDPYVRVRAYTNGGHTRTKNTNYKSGTHYPTWNQWLDFGSGNWTRFTVKVWDADSFLNGADDSMSSTHTYHLDQHTTRTYITMPCNRGYIIFDYYFQA